MSHDTCRVAAVLLLFFLSWPFYGLQQHHNYQKYTASSGHFHNHEKSQCKFTQETLTECTCLACNKLQDACENLSFWWYFLSFLNWYLCLRHVSLFDWLLAHPPVRFRKRKRFPLLAPHWKHFMFVGFYTSSCIAPFLLLLNLFNSSFWTDWITSQLSQL